MKSDTGKVAAIIDARAVVINMGREHGVEEGDSFYLYVDLGPFVDPDTGDSLGSAREFLGKVTVETLEDRMCIAKTGYTATSSVDRLMRSWAVSEAIRLNVDESMSVDRKVKIGTLALHVPRAAGDDNNGDESDSGSSEEGTRP